MAKFLCKVWNADRSLKKAFMCEASLDLIITKASSYSLQGNKIVLESDGTEIDDDEVLQAVLEEKNTLIILNSGEIWTPVVAHENIPQNFQVVPQSSSAGAITITSVEEIVSSLHTANPCEDQDNFPISLNSSTNGAAACDGFHNYKIPWNKMSPEITHALKSKQKIGKLINQFCNVIVDELRQITPYIPMSVYRNIAHMAAIKHPNSFVEKDGQGHVMSYTPVSLITTMRNRNNFLNCSSKSKLSDIPNKKRKTFSVLSRSCVHWQPEIDTENLEDVACKKEMLISMHQKTKLLQSEVESVKKYMADCFATLRTFFNNAQNPPTVRDILQNWPMIFTKECLFDHFHRIMELDTDSFKRNFDSSQSKLKAFFKLHQSDGAETILQSICLHFNERVTLLFQKFTFGTTIDGVKGENKTATPWISIIGTSPTEDISVAYIWLEGEITYVEKNADIISLILQILCYYYIFNIEYPKDISQSCEFFIRYFFMFYPTQIRGKKKHINNVKKVNSLISKLDEIL